MTNRQIIYAWGDSPDSVTGQWSANTFYDESTEPYVPLAAVAAAYEDAAKTVAHSGEPAATQALSNRLCCNGVDCGCRGSTVEEYLLYLIRSRAPANALAALERERRKAKNEALDKAINEVASYDADCPIQMTYGELADALSAMKEPEE